MQRLGQLRDLLQRGLVEPLAAEQVLGGVEQLGAAQVLALDAPHLAPNLRNYIAGFSPNMRDVLEKFDFDNTITKLDEMRFFSSHILPIVRERERHVLGSAIATA